MKKIYEKPYVEIENYELSSNIASNCALVVNMGPEGPGAIEVCDDYYEKTGETKPQSRISTFSLPHNVQFWSEETCDCYYSAGSGCFTS
ncbi:MAG: hypothetical protein MR966_08195 [Lachnospiraceae bacterium]|nr:hypothetical protein [Lachnospiraceae bacterium]